MEESAGADGTAVLYADDVPYPIASYAVSDGAVILRAVNPAFGDLFAPSVAGSTVREWWSEHGLASQGTGGEALASALTENEPVDTRVTYGEAPDDDRSGVTYALQSSPRGTEAAPPTGDGDGADGHLFLTPVDSTADQIEADRLASIVSHDLRNPLDVAEAHLQAARETGDAVHFEHLEDAHERMERIIRDVLTLARGRGAINRSDGVDVEAVADDAWRTVDTGDASLVTADALPAVEADPDRLQRLFENLFRNAVEHGSTSSRPSADDAVEHGSTSPPSQAPEDAVEHGSTSSRPEADDAAEHAGGEAGGDGTDEGLRVRVGTIDGGFYVADDGPGVPPEDGERVFEPGYSAHENGTGLGLTIVRRIADAHGWTVSLTTGDDGGARFEFRGLADPGG